MTGRTRGRGFVPSVASTTLYMLPEQPLSGLAVIVTGGFTSFVQN